MGDKKDSIHEFYEKMPQQKEKNLHKLITRLSKQSLKTSQKIFDEHTFSKLQKQYDQALVNERITIFIQQLITQLLTWALKIKQALTDFIKPKDYEVLEISLQKAEAEIRRHIRLEQQMKLYLDTLEERNDELEDRLCIEEQKYNLLSESYKQLDLKYKDNIKKPQIRAQSNIQQVFHHDSLIHQSSNENVLSRKNRIGLKSRYMIDKIQQKSKKMYDKKRNYLMSVCDQDLTFQRSTNQMKVKNSSIQKGKRDNSKNASIGQLTKSLHMKKQKSFESYVRKMSKFRTQSKQQQGKSNSIISQHKL